MAITTQDEGAEVTSDFLNQFPDIANGTPGAGQPLLLTDIGSTEWLAANPDVDPDDLWALTVRHRTGNHQRWLDSDGNVIASVTDAGLTFDQAAIDSLALPGTLGVTGIATLTTLNLSTALRLPATNGYDSTGKSGLSVRENVSGTPHWGLERIFTPEQYGAVRDGITDDGAALQACLTAAKNNRGVMQLSAGRYRCNQVLRCNSANGVTMRGPAVGSSNAESAGYGRCTIRFSSSIGSGTVARNHLLEVVGSKFVTLEDFNIEGDTDTGHLSDPHSVTGPADGSIATCIFVAPTGATTTEGGQHITLRRMNVSGPVTTAVVYIWSAFYVTIENCGFFVNGTQTQNAALALTSVNYGGLWTTDTAVTVTGGTQSGGANNGATATYAASHIDGMRQVSVRQSLISNQSSGTNTRGIRLDSVKSVTFSESEANDGNGASPVFLIVDSSPSDFQSSDITIKHCQVGGGSACMVESACISTIRNLEIDGCWSGNLSGPVVKVSADGGKLRGLRLRGQRSTGGVSPSAALDITSSGASTVLMDSEIHASVWIEPPTSSDVTLAVNVHGGVIDAATNLFYPGTVTASTDNSTKRP